MAGVVLTVKMAKKYPEYQWALAMLGLSLEGLSCIIIPFSTNYFMLMFPISIICFGIALIDTALLPTLGFIVDKKYTSVYGSVYAIADISYSAAYAFGPVVAGHIVENMGFMTLNMIVAVISLVYAPVIWYLKDMHDYNKYEEPGMEENVLMGDPPTKEYVTYNLTHGKPQLNGTQPGYEPVQQQPAQETAFNEPPSANPFRQPQGSNPFRR